MKVRRLWILGALVVALALSACGQESQPTSLLNNGVYVDAGPITYQLQISRVLNQYSTEDRQYLAGLPAGTVAPRANQLWYGVFLWAKNQTEHPNLTASKFDIVDSNGQHYFPIRVNGVLNAYAWTRQSLPASGVAAGAEHDRVLRPDRGQPAAVQTAEFGVLQPAADAPDLPRRVVQARRDLTRSLIRRRQGVERRPRDLRRGTAWEAERAVAVGGEGEGEGAGAISVTRPAPRTEFRILTLGEAESVTAASADEALTEFARPVRTAGGAARSFAPARTAGRRAQWVAWRPATST